MSEKKIRKLIEAVLKEYCPKKPKEVIINVNVNSFGPQVEDVGAEAVIK